MSDEELGGHSSALAAGLFKDRRVVISGGGSGIGRATAWLAARLGAQVLICGRSLEKLTRVSTALTARGLSCQALALDIRDRAAVDRFFDEAFARFGPPDVRPTSARMALPPTCFGHIDKRIETSCGEHGPRAPPPRSILRRSRPSSGS